jgi:hypothetical protein
MSNQPRRVQRSRKKGARLPPNTVCVDRNTAFGNTYQVVRINGEWFVKGMVDYCYHAKNRKDAHQKAVELFKEFRLPMLLRTRNIQRDLVGKNLACFCPPELPCHADVLLKLANPGEST